MFERILVGIQGFAAFRDPLLGHHAVAFQVTYALLIDANDGFAVCLDKPSHLSEYEGVSSVVERAAFIEEHGRLGAELAAHYGDLQTAQNAIEDDYAGVYRSLSEFAEELTEQTTQIPHSLQYYIDYERMARDLEVNDVFTVELGFEEIHVFWSR